MFTTPTITKYRLKLSSKNQLTLPKSFVQTMGFNSGDYVSFVIQNDKTATIQNDIDNINELFGSLNQYIPKHLKNLTSDQLKVIYEDGKSDYYKSKFSSNAK